VVDRHLHAAPEAAPGADEPVLADARRQTVLAALGDLPRRQREVLVLRYYLDLSEREIAETLGISQGAVKSHASRAAAALRAVLPNLQEES
jgi:RNA polymerase sigma factor (sigma-70 family)